MIIPQIKPIKIPSIVPEFNFINLMGLDGNFDVNLNNFSLIGVPVISSERAKSGTNSLKCVCAGASCGAYKDITVENGHVLYICCSVFLSAWTSGTSFGIIAYDKSGFNNNVIDAPSTSLLNIWQFISVLKTTANGGVRINCGGITSPTLTVYIDNVYILDLTAIFGAGNEPSKAKMDIAIKSYTEYNGFQVSGTIKRQ